MKAFRLLGVPVRLHFTFILLLIFLIVTDLGAESSGSFALFIIGLFASVLLHELSHAMVAKAFQVQTEEIVMFPIGGVSRMKQDLPPTQELWISLAGPVSNIVIAGALFAYLAATGQGMDFKLSEMLQPTNNGLIPRLAFGNLLLAGFNLLPAFPMDGGRILRALLSFIRPKDEATRMAAWMGRALAISMGLYGLIGGNFMLVFIAFFVYLGAAQEGVAAMGRQLTHGIPVRAAMITRFEHLEHGATVRDAANLLLATSQQDFPVMHGDQVIGLLDRNLLLKALAQEGPDAYVSGVMDREYVTLEPDADLSAVLPVMAQAGRCALVMEGGKLLGLLTAENLSEFLMLRRVGMEPAVQA